MSLLRASVTADALGSNYGGANPALLTDATGWSTSNDGGPDTPALTYVPAASLPAPSPIGMGGAAKVTYTGSNNNNTPFPASLNIPHLGLVFGVTYTVSLWIYMPSGTADPANTGITDLSIVASNSSSTTNMSGQRDQWVQVHATFTADSFPILAMWTGPSAVAGQYFYATGVLIQTGPDLGNFCLGGGAEGDAAPVLVDGADTACTANGLSGYLPSPGDRLLVDQVSGTIEIVQFLSRGRPPGLTSTDYSDLSTRIDTAQTSANGKNTVHYSTSAPGTTSNTAGDIWWQYDATSGNVVAHYQGLGGTSWTSRPLDNAVIATLDAAKITTGFLDVANRLKASSISVDKLMVGGAHNLVQDPQFDNLGSWGMTSPWSVTTGVTPVPTGDTNGNAMRVVTATAYTQITENTLIPVTPGEPLQIQYAVRRASGTVSAPGSLGLAVYFYDTNGSFVTNVNGLMDPSTLTTTAWTYIDVERTVPANVAYAHAALVVTAATTGNGTYDFDVLAIKRKATGSLIVNGAIDGQTITGAILQTASTGNRVVIWDNGTEGIIQCWSGASGETQPSSIIASNNSPGVPSLDLASGQTATYTGIGAISLRATSTTHGAVILNGDVYAPDGLQFGGFSLSPNGRKITGINFGNSTATANTSGQVVVNHGMTSTPVAVLVQGQTNNRLYRVVSITGTQFTIEGTVGTTNVVVGSGSNMAFYWLALA